jgi:quinoprotein glucose dehydrogenase
MAELLGQKVDSSSSRQRPTICCVIDERTGEVLWSVPLPTRGQATPMIYQQNGREFLVIFAGGHHFMEKPMGDSIIAYAHPQSG